MSDRPAVLPDGRYDVLVVDVGEVIAAGGFRVELVITAGPAKGETVTVRVEPTGPTPGSADGPGPSDPIELLGLPGRVTVDQGRPTFTLDD